MPSSPAGRGGEDKRRARSAMLKGEAMKRVGSFVGVALGVMLASPAFAEDGMAGARRGDSPGEDRFGHRGARHRARQGRATAAAMESIGRNPNSADKDPDPFIIGLALMEALTLYALVIAFSSGSISTKSNEAIGDCRPGRPHFRGRRAREERSGRPTAVMRR